MLGKLRFRWTGPFWSTRKFRRSYQLSTLAGKVLDKWVNGFRLKPYQGPMPKNPFKKPKTGMKGITKEPAPTTELVPSGMKDKESSMKKKNDMIRYDEQSLRKGMASTI